MILPSCLSWISIYLTSHLGCMLDFIFCFAVSLCFREMHIHRHIGNKGHDWNLTVLLCELLLAFPEVLWTPHTLCISRDHSLMLRVPYYSFSPYIFHITHFLLTFPSLSQDQKSQVTHATKSGAMRGEWNFCVWFLSHLFKDSHLTWISFF